MTTRSQQPPKRAQPARPAPTGPKATFQNLPEEKRRRIVDLAVEEFSEHPYGQASLSRIVTRAGIAKGSIYQYFDDKFALYRWLFLEEVAHRKIAYLAAHPPPAAGDLFAALEHMFLIGLRFLAENPRLARLAGSVMEPSADPEIRDFHAEIRRLGHAEIARMLRAAQARGEVRADLDPALASSFVSALMGSGLSDALLHKLGVGLHQFLASPEIAARLPERELRALAHEAASILRDGLSPKKESPR
jgi:AcrR family transcriptional regulator